MLNYKKKYCGRKNKTTVVLLEGVSTSYFLVNLKLVSCSRKLNINDTKNLKHIQ